MEDRTLLLEKGEVVGHMFTLQTAAEIMLHISKTLIPQPLQVAYNLAAQTRLKLAEKQSKYLQKQ